jgi:hypothetical protein
MDAALSVLERETNAKETNLRPSPCHLLAWGFLRPRIVCELCEAELLLPEETVAALPAARWAAELAALHDAATLTNLLSPYPLSPWQPLPKNR